MTDPIPPTEWNRTQWSDLPHTFKRICVLKGRIINISMMTQANQSLLDSGTLDNLHESIMNDSYCDIEWDPRPDLPPELISGITTRVYLCVYDQGLFKSHHVVLDESGTPIEPLINGLWNIPWMAFSDGALNTDGVGDMVTVIYDPLQSDIIPLADRLILVGHSRFEEDNKEYVQLGTLSFPIKVPVLGGINGYITTEEIINSSYSSSEQSYAWQDLVVFRNNYLHRFSIVRALRGDASGIPSWTSKVTLQYRDVGNTRQQETILIVHNRPNYYKAENELAGALIISEYYWDSIQLLLIHYTTTPRNWISLGTDALYPSGEVAEKELSVKSFAHKTGSIGIKSAICPPMYPLNYAVEHEAGTFDFHGSNGSYTVLSSFPAVASDPNAGKIFKCVATPIRDVDGLIQDYSIVKEYITANNYQIEETSSRTIITSSNCSNKVNTSDSSDIRHHEATIIGDGTIAEIDSVSLITSANDSSVFDYNKVIHEVTEYQNTDCDGDVVAYTLREIMNLQTTVSVDRTFSFKYSDGFELELGKYKYDITTSRIYDSVATETDPAFDPLPTEDITFSGTFIYFIDVNMTEEFCVFIQVTIDEITQTHDNIDSSNDPTTSAITSAKIELKYVANRTVTTIETVTQNSAGDSNFSLGNIWKDIFWEYDDLTTYAKPSQEEAVGQFYFTDPSYYDLSGSAGEGYTKFIPNIVREWPFVDGTRTYTWGGAVLPPHNLDFLHRKLLELFKYFARWTYQEYSPTQGWQSFIDQVTFLPVGSKFHARPTAVRNKKIDGFSCYFGYNTSKRSLDNEFLMLLIESIIDPSIKEHLFFIKGKLELKMTADEFKTFRYKKIT